MSDDWLHFTAFPMPPVEVIDANGTRVDFVRAARDEGNGVRVRILASAGNGRTKVLTRTPDGDMDVCEFEAFIRGGRLRHRPPESA